MFNQLDEAKKMRIINAAISEFADKGYASASTNEIARKAQISKGSLFHYFGTKEKLYDWLIKYSAGIIEAALYESEQIRNEDFIEVLVQSALVKMKVFRGYPSLKDFFIRLYQDNPHGKDRLTENLTEILVRFQSNSLNQVNPEKFRNDLTTEEALRISYWILEGMSREFIAKELLPDEEQMMKFTREMLEILKKLLYKEEYQ